jgi:glycosyltransferase involved in cell wall biosynthesis
VIVPVFNEEKTIDEILRRILAQPVVKEVLVVDDFSRDDTWKRLQGWSKDQRVHLLRHSHNQGKGAAIRTAIPHAIAPIIIIQDGDLEYDPADYASMLYLIQSGQADVVYGSRFAGEQRHENPFWHTQGNRVLTWMGNFAAGLRLTDGATCYKMFRREVLAQMALEENRFGFCPEVTAKAAKLGARFAEVPISYQGRRVSEGKKIRLHDGFNALWCIVKYNWLRK